MRLYKLFPILFAFLVACGSNGDDSSALLTHQAETAAQEVLKAATQGEWELENALLDAKATQSQYSIAGDESAAAEFDRIFRQYIKERNDTLANQIF